MATTFSAILSSLKTTIAGVTVPGGGQDPSATTTIISADAAAMPDKGTLLIIIKPGARKIAGYAGGLHQKTVDISVHIWKRVMSDQAREDETKLTSATLGVLAIDDAIEKALVRDTLGGKLDEALQLVSQSEPVKQDMGWINVEQRYTSMYSQTVTDLKA